MKKNAFTLAFMLVFAFSTTAFADGELGNGNKTPVPPPPTAASTQTTSSSSLLTQILNVIYAIVS